MSIEFTISHFSIKLAFYEAPRQRKENRLHLPEDSISIGRRSYHLDEERVLVKPRKSDLKAILETCNETSKVLGSVEEDVVMWAVHKEKVLSAYNRLLRKKSALVEKFPERWLGMTASQVAAGQVFTHPKRTRKYLHNFRDELRPEEVALLQYFIQEPWFYSVLILEDILEMDFFTVVDVENRDRYLLYSQSVREVSRTGARLYLTLLFYNGECYQTFGPLHYYRGFQPYDFEYFAKLLSPLFYLENGLSATIANNPTPFLLLDVSTETPPVAHKDKLVQICSQEFPLADFDAQRYSKDFEIESKHAVVRCKLKGEDNPFRSAAAFYDGTKKKLFVRATQLDLYRKIRDILAENIPLPEDPYWFASMNMKMTANEVLDKDIPATSYVDMFEEDQKPLSPEEKRQLDTFNALLQDLSLRRNEGVHYRLEDLAEKHGVDLETARQAEEIYDQASSKLDIDIDGGLEGYQPPPPGVRQEFRRPPWNNRAFVFMDSPRVRGLFSSLQSEIKNRVSKHKPGSAEGPPDSLDAFPNWLEELYFETQAQRDYTLLNVTLHLLCSRGEEMEAVRDYAVEVLRLYWQIFVASKEPEQIENFIGEFARFCFEVLYCGGLADIDPVVTKRTAGKAEFRLRPSAFLRAWASLTRNNPAHRGQDRDG